MEKVKRDSVIEFLEHSNAIEGVTDGQSLRDAISAWDYLIQQPTINPQVVRKVHKMLMVTQPLDTKYKGHYRNCPVYIGGHEALKHTKIAEEMRYWCAEMNQKPTREPFEMKESFAKCLHIQYEKIHPWLDGNGRTGRMFMNWQRLKILDLPLLVIHTGERFDYYKWFK